MSARRSTARRAAQRGLTLLEVMVSIGILAVIASLIYGAFDGMRRSREGITRTGDRFHEGRGALTRMSRELSSAFISLHRPDNIGLITRQTLFIGTTRSPVDRVDFTSFSHRRTGKGSHESDQNELSYFGSRDPETGAIDLVRRMSPNIDEDARRGGVVQVLAHDVASVDFAYLDGPADSWSEDWDSTQAAGQAERLPTQVRITIALNRGVGEDPLVFTTKVALGMQQPIGLATAAAALGTAATPPPPGPFGDGANPFTAGPGGRRQTPTQNPFGGGMGR